MDLVAACSGFLYALITGMQFVATGGSKRTLVIGADTNSRVLDPTDKTIYPLFGDGAGAAILAPGSPEQGALSYTTRSACPKFPLDFLPSSSKEDRMSYRRNAIFTPRP